jgi:uncharacterized membrane protein
MWTRKELKGKAKEALKRNYWKAVLAACFLSLLIGGFNFNYHFGDKVTSNFNNFCNNETVNGMNKTQQLFTSNNFKGMFHQATNEVGNHNLILVGIVMAIVILIIVLIVVTIAILIDALLWNPFIVGIRRFFVQDLDHKAELKELAYGFDHNYKNVVKTMFFRDLFVFLWTLLFIIPGIVKAYEYRMIVYIMGENPDMDRQEAFTLSKKMMSGQKWKAFVLDLSFIGWYLLSLCTFGLLNVFYVSPYCFHTSAALYITLKNDQEVI